MSMSLYASKEEYEQAHAARWYCLDRDGVAMLCKDEADARTQAAENDDCWPGRAPHRAVLLGEVSAALSAAEKTPRDPLEIEELWDEAHELLEQGGGHGPEVHELFARLIERAHGIGA